nr:polyprenyl synthetase family protein [Kibdelosporangium sp. MJ126-NF4]CEL16260.1 Octaprenyl diphosphate synthase / Dimethylallyltransferase / Geranyltranstransferase / Geranylgeranyl diphosphate synthase [Kibdelosporangium sp. MJ126-NF4]CTQ94184.1 Octaprenyl diphosphate synthase (EC 2.5.1.90) / Dimethylallyltransferase (EC 2.5.1.1) / Geranyltranstransferase (EC 2.5.1.10) / Geranylgeranyl diphosphate synthase (EC 2.5.1.29) [Kibdelosporangium sp. MJ126-NF4]
MNTSTGARPRAASAVVDAVDAELASAMRAQLGQVETRLRETLRDPANQFVGQAATHLIEAGGKRFRPMMVLLGARFGDPCVENVLDAAVLAELVHVATLYHDDVMDEARVRHGAVTANTRWGNTVAVLLGDYLLAKAAELGAGLGDTALRLQIRTLGRLIRGQMAETVGVPAQCDPVGYCLRVMSDKSASLIAMSARIGALVAGADSRVADALEEYGELLGMAFQISDDILDIEASERELGKAPGTDLREGIVTLPVLYAIEHDPSIADLVAEPITDDERRARVLGVLRASPGLDQARQEADRHAQRAKDILSDLPAIPAREALFALCDFVTYRTT